MVCCLFKSEAEEEDALDEDSPRDLSLTKVRLIFVKLEVNAGPLQSCALDRILKPSYSGLCC